MKNETKVLTCFIKPGTRIVEPQFGAGVWVVTHRRKSRYPGFYQIQARPEGTTETHMIKSFDLRSDSYLALA